MRGTGTTDEGTVGDSAISRAVVRRADGRVARLMVAAIAISGSLACMGPASAGETRAISLYNIHTKETTSEVFRRGGAYDEKALERLNWFLRDWRENEPTKMDPRLFDLLADIHDELGSNRPIHVISGYRSPKTNNMLRNTRGGQASKSQHMLGRAIDVHFPDVSVRKLRYSAMVRQVGGVGYYPGSAKPFVHVDTGRVRHWPRMARHELALLFPSGRSRHVPSDNRPLTAEDSSTARKSHPELAVALATFHDVRAGRSPAPPRGPAIGTWQTGTQIAAAMPRLIHQGPAERPVQPLLPRLVQGTAPAARDAAPREAPRLVAPPRQLALAGVGLPRVPHTDEQRAQERRLLTRLASLSFGATLGQPSTGDEPRGRSSLARVPGAERPETGSAARATGGVPRAQRPAIHSTNAITSEYDDEHPDELSYRPFPIAPYLTATSSSDDVALVKLERPDPATTLETIEEADQLLTSRLTYGASVRPQARTQFRFSGAAIRPILLVRPADIPGTRPVRRAAEGAQKVRRDIAQR